MSRVSMAVLDRHRQRTQLKHNRSFSSEDLDGGALSRTTCDASAAGTLEIVQSASD